MSCEDLQDQLARLEFSLSEEPFDQMIARNMTEKLEIECRRLPSSYTATVGRTMAGAGLDDHKVEDIQREVHGRFVKTAQKLIERFNEVKSDQAFK